jgi:hypothetical protein
MSVETGFSTSSVPGGLPGGDIPITTPTWAGTSVPIATAAGATPPAPADAVRQMTQRILQTFAQNAQRKQFAGTPIPAQVPGMRDPAAARNIGMNTANPRAWGGQRLMAGIATSIQNAVAQKKQRDLTKAEADWTYMSSALNELYTAQASGNPQAVAEAQSKVDVVMGDPKKLKAMAKALNQDWLAPEKTTVYGEALKKVASKTEQTAGQKEQAKQGVMGLLRSALQRQPQPQLSPEQRTAMAREIEKKAPTTTPGLDPKAIEAQEKILHDRANEALAAGRDATAAAYKKAALSIQEVRLAQEKDDKAAKLKLQEKAEEERVRHDRAMESISSKRATSSSGGGTGGGAKLIADAIIKGQQPPTTTGLYKEGAAVREELARQGFNLQQAESDWKAVQKHLSTLNGPQQERLRQAVTFTYDSLDNIEDLYNQWQKTKLPGGFSTYNKLALEAAMKLPGEAGSIATRLHSQINDLTSELGTVYKGGNASTDETLRLAAENLKAEWNDRTFKDALGLVRNNLRIRKNSIDNSMPAGVSAGSPYTPKSETAGAADMETQTYNGATYQRKKGSKDEWKLAPAAKAQ